MIYTLQKLFCYFNQKFVKVMNLNSSGLCQFNNVTSSVTVTCHSYRYICCSNYISQLIPHMHACTAINRKIVNGINHNVNESQCQESQSQSKSQCQGKKWQLVNCAVQCEFNPKSIILDNMSSILN